VADGPDPVTGWAASRQRLDDGRWHFAQGPIDLIIGLDGEPAACAAAIERAWRLFEPVLSALVAELPRLREACPIEGVDPGQSKQDSEVDSGVRAAASPVPAPQGPVACRMYEATARLARATGLFITPMAAVAGAVADHLIGCFGVPGVHRAYVNNGGDIALHLGPGMRYRVGVVGRFDAPALDAAFEIDSRDSVRGVASSGWRGRSLSLGIADTVTVIAQDAAAADAAATLIANAVDVDDPAIERAPASAVRDDSDLGDRLVTVAVGALSGNSIDLALDAGEAFARRLSGLGLIDRAALLLADRWRVVPGPFPTLPLMRDD
jgi:ApbE superfamily uncharacterized protein (UPF0280 family)